jgi:hypothetical protein
MKAILTCISLSLIVFTGDILAQGSTYHAGEIVRISEKDSIFTQTFATGETIEMFGWIGNDLVSASESLIIEGEIMDDAIIAGGNLTLRGTVHDLLAAAGETIVIDGQVFGDVFAAGATIRITDNAVIKGNAHLAGQRIIFDNGIIEGYLKVAGSELELNGMVQQKTEIYGHNIKFGPQYNATLGTDIYTDRAVYPENFVNPPGNLNIYETEQDVLGIILFNGALYLSLFITGVLLISIFKNTSRDLYRFSTEQFWKNTGVGFLTFLFYPMVVVLLAILVLTIPISILLLLLYGLILLFGYLLVALVIGVSSFQFLKKSDSEINYYWGLFVGMILLAIIVNLPFLGWLFHSVFIFFGLGSMILYLWEMKNLSTSQVEADT